MFHTDLRDHNGEQLKLPKLRDLLEGNAPMISFFDKETGEIRALQNGDLHIYNKEQIERLHRLTTEAMEHFSSQPDRAA